ncbi:MAG: hypothetical protein P8168_04445 [Deltaproteobacteria bacterium]
MSYTLRIDKQAAKALKALDKATIRRIHFKFQQLSQNGQPPPAVPLSCTRTF